MTTNTEDLYTRYIDVFNADVLPHLHRSIRPMILDVFRANNGKPDADAATAVTMATSTLLAVIAGSVVLSLVQGKASSARKFVTPMLKATAADICKALDGIEDGSLMNGDGLVVVSAADGKPFPFDFRDHLGPQA